MGGIDIIVFCSFDVVALVIQAVGGGIASKASQVNNQKGANLVGLFKISASKYIDSDYRGDILC